MNDRPYPILPSTPPCPLRDQSPLISFATWRTVTRPLQHVSSINRILLYWSTGCIQPISLLPLPLLLIRRRTIRHRIHQLCRKLLPRLLDLAQKPILRSSVLLPRPLFNMPAHASPIRSVVGTIGKSHSLQNQTRARVPLERDLRVGRFGPAGGEVVFLREGDLDRGRFLRRTSLVSVSRWGNGRD